jgi:hypothetical protein
MGGTCDSASSSPFPNTPDRELSKKEKKRLTTIRENIDEEKKLLYFNKAPLWCFKLPSIAFHTRVAAAIKTVACTLGAGCPVAEGAIWALVSKSCAYVFYHPGSSLKV